MTPKQIEKVLKDNNQGILLDIGCGKDKQPGFVGMDYTPYEGVDIVHDVTKFPWPLPDESCSCIMVSHMVEHITKSPIPIQLTDLVNLLIKKELLTQEEVKETIGDLFHGSTFVRFMDECWRVLKPDGQLMMVFPYGGSLGFWQDPTHLSGYNEITWAYFDPLDSTVAEKLYTLYQPKPWKVDYSTWNPSQNMEVCLVKRRDDFSYHKDQ